MHDVSALQFVAQRVLRRKDKDWRISAFATARTTTTNTITIWSNWNKGFLRAPSVFVKICQNHEPRLWISTPQSCANKFVHRTCALPSSWNSRSTRECLLCHALQEARMSSLSDFFGSIAYVFRLHCSFACLQWVAGGFSDWQSTVYISTNSVYTYRDLRISRSTYISFESLYTYLDGVVLLFRSRHYHSPQ